MVKELKFIHITKTAGTSIEDVGFHNNIAWGRFHAEEYGWWHEIFKNKPDSLKSKYDWFTVVRNPYDRIVSEFHCLHGGVRRFGGENVKDHTVKSFNDFLKDKITNWKTLVPDRYGICRQLSPLGDHYTPQYLYLDPNYTIHVLKFENIEQEFNNLMSLYNLNLTLNKKVNNYEKIFSIKDMDDELINLIEKTYHEDFIKFEYNFIQK